MRRIPSWVGGVVATLAIFFALGSWSIASPVGSSPDDNFHLASIWCGQGLREGICEEGDSSAWRRVPHNLNIGLCYDAQPQKPGTCTIGHLQADSSDMMSTKSVNAKGLYPPGYYWVYSFFVGPDIGVTTIAIRLVNTLLFAALTVGAWFAVPRRVRPALGWSTAAAVVPLGMFTVASINPSSWAITALAVLFPTALGFLLSTGRRRIVLAGFMLLAAAMAFSARGDAAIYAAVSLMAALVLAFRPRRSFLLAAILPAALIAAAAIAPLLSGQVGSAMGGLSTAQPVASRSELFVQNFVNLPSLIAGAFGQTWGLGWLETIMPPLVWACAIFVAAGTVFAALHWQGWRKALALAGVGSAIVAIPMYILVASGVLVGSQVQPRYLLPLILVFIAVALAPSEAPNPARRSGALLTPMQLIVGAVVLAVGNAVALLFAMRRYVAPDRLFLDHAIQWWWPMGPSPMTTVVIGSAAFAVALVVLVVAYLRISARRPEPATVEGTGRQPTYEASASA
ncbi:MULTISPECIES: DUF2142 domain-containing protein [unclassified Microbacterium]|uniref:DUF2142 domain-containing protein n=1 Tax=unclassified Microbacterium TaxID=2609290 RepID=UPI0036518185